MTSLDEKTFATHARWIKALEKDVELLRRRVELSEDEVRVLREELGALE